MTGSLPQVLLWEQNMSSYEKSVQLIKLHFWKDLWLLRIQNNFALLLDTIWALKHNFQIVICHFRCTRSLCIYAFSFTLKKHRSLLSAVSCTSQISRMLKMTFMLKQADSLTRCCSQSPTGVNAHKVLGKGKCPKHSMCHHTVNKTRNLN